MEHSILSVQGIVIHKMFFGKRLTNPITENCNQRAKYDEIHSADYFLHCRWGSTTAALQVGEVERDLVPLWFQGVHGHRTAAIQLDAGIPSNFGGHLGSGRIYLGLWLLGLARILQAVSVGTGYPSGRVLAVLSIREVGIVQRLRQTSWKLPLLGMDGPSCILLLLAHAFGTITTRQPSHLCFNL